jgi:hypothetical protein
VRITSGNFSKGWIWICRDEKSGKDCPFLIINPMKDYGIYAFALPSTTQKARDEYDVQIRDWEEANLINERVIRVSWGRMLPQGAFKFPIGKLTEYDKRLFLEFLSN